MRQLLAFGPPHRHQLARVKVIFSAEDHLFKFGYF